MEKENTIKLGDIINNFSESYTLSLQLMSLFYQHFGLIPGNLLISEIPRLLVLDKIIHKG